MQCGGRLLYDYVFSSWFSEKIKAEKKWPDFGKVCMY